MNENNIIHLQHAMKRNEHELSDMKVSFEEALRAYELMRSGGGNGGEEDDVEVSMALEKEIVCYLNTVCNLAPKAYHAKVFCKKSKSIKDIVAYFFAQEDSSAKREQSFIKNAVAEFEKLETEEGKAKTPERTDMAWPADPDNRVDVSIVFSFQGGTVFRSKTTSIDATRPIESLVDFILFYYSSIDDGVEAYFVARDECARVTGMNSAIVRTAGQLYVSQICESAKTYEKSLNSLHLFLVFPEEIMEGSLAKKSVEVNIAYPLPRIVLTAIDMPIGATLHQAREIIRGLSVLYHRLLFLEDEDGDSSSPDDDSSGGSSDESEKDFGEEEPKWLRRKHKREAVDILNNKVHVLAGINHAESFVFLHRGERISNEIEPVTQAVVVAVDNGSADMIAQEQTDGLLLILADDTDE